ncbi:TOBE domain-containing protein [Dactylosporangium sp. AC04546]|uniref:TOBE domain-containing protein n=1 Tax=Dactylosporangium sp. AC04546 TaxID=2862460 RepID=UPI001EE028AE|nr:TOBE domain-containing protein [Dactylosporangium sp. AC04546]WVK87313.1 TOBE domain-containing protein [Dactylosporangium sp. AC04546]
MRDSSVLVRDAGPLTAAEPAINRIPAMLVGQPGRPLLAVRGQQVPARALVRRRPMLRRYLGRSVIVGVQPEDVQDAVVRRPGPAGSAALVLHGTVRDVRLAGALRVVHLELADGEGFAEPAPVLVALLSGGSVAGVGDPIMLAIDLGHLMVFDAQSGLSLW